jgi:hypothetical protein
MAFQNKNPLFDFLRTAASSADLERSAPAENHILDERVADPRENDFLALSGFAASAPATVEDWFKQLKDYGITRVARAATSATFDTINQQNWLTSLQPDWDVVRIETIIGLCSRDRVSGVDEAEAVALIREMLDARQSGRPFDPFNEARLEKWLDEVNDGSDQRPAFVAPYAEVEAILRLPVWANRLRDALGLGHIRPSSGRPTLVVLMQYNLERVYRNYIGRPAWAATPTVLDDVPTAGPNPCFFPAPIKASTNGFGFTIDLDGSNGSFMSEFLHGRIAYALNDIRAIGEVTTDVTAAQIAGARDRFRNLLSADLQHLGDLP